MEHNMTVHPFCDVCGKELSTGEIEKNAEFDNYEFPICETCFNYAIEKIKYIINN